MFKKVLNSLAAILNSERFIYFLLILLLILVFIVFVTHLIFINSSLYLFI
jgi:hypothetical protein